MRSSSKNHAIFGELKDLLRGPEELQKRLKNEINFALSLTYFNRRNQQKWEHLISETLSVLKEGISREEKLELLVQKAEEILSPIGESAKEYSIHYVAHAHLDMNWLWSWRDTVMSCARTFSTVLKLMEEFPAFCFSQSQAVVYEIMEKYYPEFFEKIKERIKGGQWEVTASTWVEGDKNMASGESQVRQIVYAKKFLKEKLALDLDEMKVGWEPDTFGHPKNTPSILNQAGIKYYYLHRPGGSMQPDIKQGKYGQLPRLFWWKAEDDSRVLTWNDEKLTYNGHVNEEEVIEVLTHQEQTGMKDYLIVYGVGDHGGGPSREDIKKIKRMSNWPIFPTIHFGKVHKFFQLVEGRAKDLPVISKELNFVFRGCYSSQSSIKHANRKMESSLTSAEIFSSIANIHTSYEYSGKLIEDGWKKVCFNQFHDILPGSGIKETSEHALSNYQEVNAIVSSIEQRSLKSIVSGISTKSDKYEDSIPIVVFNPTSRPRSDIVEVILYGFTGDEDLLAVDEEGNTYPIQIIENLESLREKKQKGSLSLSKLPNPRMLLFDLHYEHHFVKGVFVAENVPPIGYKTFWIKRDRDKIRNTLKHQLTKETEGIENESLRAEIEAKSGSIISLYDKVNQRELIPKKGRFGILNLEWEEPHEMSAWIRGRVTDRLPLKRGGVLKVVEDGPVLVIARYENKIKNSKFQLDIKIYRGINRIDFELDVDWQEVGNNLDGVPTLNVEFPLAVEKPRFFYDIPFGYTIRKPDGMDVPAQKWGAINGSSGKGITVANDRTYAYRGEGNTLSLTLLRSSYEPDPLPEFGNRKIRYSIYPHGPEWAPLISNWKGLFFNRPLRVLRADTANGKLPSRHSSIVVEPENVMVCAVKKAEGGSDVIIRLREIGGKETNTLLKTHWTIKKAGEVDFLESPTSFIEIDSNEMKVTIGPNEVKTLRLKFANS